MQNHTISKIENVVPDMEQEEIVQITKAGEHMEKYEFDKWWKESDSKRLDADGAFTARDVGLLDGSNIRGWSVGKQIRDGRSTGKMCITVYTEIKAHVSQIEDDKVIPEVYEGIPVNVIEGGLFRARSQTMMPVTRSLNPRLRYRPPPAGTSIGHYSITAGTLGCFCSTEKESPLILSNNHVLAASNAANKGDSILQPGRYDGGSETTDVIAKLYDFVPLKFNGEDNYVDASLAKPTGPVAPEILKIGKINGIVCNASVDTPVQKFGRTTNYTRGFITGINATARVDFREAGVAKFKGCYVIEPGSFSDGGDSGSIIVDDRNRARALLFGGSTSHTLANPICKVMDALQITSLL